MKEYPIEKYRFFKTSANTVIAETTYAGRKVKATAKLSPSDEFDIEIGKQLAAARCNQKVAVKRQKRATRKLAEAKRNYEFAKAEYERMQNYYSDSVEDMEYAGKKVKNILADVK